MRGGLDRPVLLAVSEREPPWKGLHMSDMTGHAGESFVAYLKDRLPLIERALHEADAVAMSHEGARPVLLALSERELPWKGLHMSDMTGHAGESFVAYLKDRLPLIERALHDADSVAMSHECAHTEDLDRYLYSALAHFTAGGGKRVRPVLALIGAEAVGGRADQALSCGIAIELFQSAALIHDDIADASELRRGEPCLYRTEGLGLAINAGDLALTRVFEIVLADGSLPAERRLRVLE